MRKLSYSLTFYYLLFLIGVCLDVFAQTKTDVVAPFSLENGDRVLFVGNSLIENDVQFGYLELALTTRWPNRNLTFRNIGWSGDNVFGDARSYVTTPPTSYELLMQQITEAKPTVVFVAYGGIEAQEGEEGLPRFKQGLNQLIDKIEKLGAKTILVSPIPLFLPTSESVSQKNTAIETYSSVIEQIAKTRNKRFINVFKPIWEVSKQFVITENGVHLNAMGYYYLATILEKGLGYSDRNEGVMLDVSKNTVETSVPTQLLSSTKEAISFVVNEPYLPLPAPQEDGRTIMVDNGRKMSIKGLKKGFYTLTSEKQVIAVASAKQWEEGVVIRQGTSFAQAEELRKNIVKKEELFFYQYRPLNQTYILGFRSYEQGRHKKGLEEQNYLITWLEAQIATANQPKPVTYQLTLLK